MQKRKKEKIILKFVRVGITGKIIWNFLWIFVMCNSSLSWPWKYSEMPNYVKFFGSCSLFPNNVCVLNVVCVRYFPHYLLIPDLVCPFSLPWITWYCPMLSFLVSSIFFSKYTFIIAYLYCPCSLSFVWDYISSLTCWKISLLRLLPTTSMINSLRCWMFVRGCMHVWPLLWSQMIHCFCRYNLQLSR